MHSNIKQPFIKLFSGRAVGKSASALLICLLLTGMFITLISISPVVSAQVTISTNTFLNSGAYPFEQHVLYIPSTNVYWYFWWNSTSSSTGFSTSTDGNTWGNFTTVTGGPSCDTSFWYDQASNTICWALGNGGTTEYYAEGTPNSNSMITWGTTYTVVTGGSGTWHAYASVCKDTDGYPWIAFQQVDADSSSYVLSVVRATTTDGSSWGSVVNITTGLDTSSRIMMVPLENDEMMAIYASYGTSIYSVLYNGSAWLSPVQATSSVLAMQILADVLML